MIPREIQSMHGVHNKMIGSGWLKLKPRQVNDDTTMAFALGEAINQDSAISN